MRSAGIGILGCGNISDIYLKNISSMFDNIHVSGVYDMNSERATAQAEKYHVQQYSSMEEMLSDREAEIILDITPPLAHYSTVLQCLQAGKHVYVEKPIALTYREAEALRAEAAQRKLLLCAAPDTFMGAAYQTAKDIIDSGEVGKIVSAATFDLCAGHEIWHPSPAFFYKSGAGPMFDRGPYNLTALISLIGPADGVFGMTSKAFEQRTITSQPLCGQVIDVEVPTHVAGLIHFKNGCVCTIIESFDAQQTILPHMELQGTGGTMILPDPNTFGGEIQICYRRKEGFKSIPLTHGYAENSRGLGVSDMANYLRNGGIPKTDSAMAAHVTEIMEALHISWEKKEYITLHGME